MSKSKNGRLRDKFKSFLILSVGERTFLDIAKKMGYIPDKQILRGKDKIFEEAEKTKS